MWDLRIDFFRETDIQKLKSLISCCTFNDYKYYGIFKKEMIQEYILQQILEITSNNRENWVIVAQDKNKIVGLVSLVKLTWAREIFDTEMAEIKHIIISDTYGSRRDIIDNLISFVFQMCNKEKIIHLSCRVNTDDYFIIHFLEANDFRIMDTLVTYLFNKRKHKIPLLKNMCKVRSFKEGDLDSLIEIVRGAFPLSRFYADPEIPKECVDRFYIKWIKECCKGSLADKILVAERKNKNVGFLTYRINRELEKLSGYKVAGRCLSSVSKRGLGDFPTLVKAFIQDIAQLYDFGECDTQINNYEVIKIWQRFGFDFVRSKYTFHKWLSKV